MDDAILQHALSHYGVVHQTRKCVEELAELQVALLHDLDGKPAAVVDELADVFVMTMQMAIVHGEEAVKERIAYKLARLSARMEGANG